MNTNLQGKEKFYYLANKEGYKILNDYINRKVKIKVQCPIFKESKGEKLILGLIDRLNIEYEKEKIFKSIYRYLLLCNKIRTLIILFK